MDIAYKAVDHAQLNQELQGLKLPDFIGTSSREGRYLEIRCGALTAEQEKAVRDVIATHGTSNPDTELAAAITAATNLAELKAALLGKTKAGKVKGQSI